MRPFSSALTTLVLLACTGKEDADCPDGFLRDNDGNCIQVESDTDTDTDADTDADTDTDVDNDGDGYIVGDDCDDNDDAINPGADEDCDEADNDCDGSIDEGVTTTYYMDSDDDGYGDSSRTTEDCSRPTGYVTNNDDCDDSDSSANPGATEDCNNNIDDNCNNDEDCDDSECSTTAECVNCYTTTITTEDDALLNEGAPSTNYDNAYLYAGASSCCVTRSVIAFDSTDFDGATITSATLTIYAMGGTCRSSYDNTDCGYDITVEVHKAEDSWSDSSVTWNSAPSYDSTVVDSTVVNEEYGASDSPYTLDVTTLVEDWAAGPNYGLVLKANSSGEATGSSQRDVIFGTFDDWDGNPDNPAELYVEYCE